ncbi:MAG: hypothetical protein AB7I27_18265 [Bacteriovoracaceae bacterium]
MKSFALWLLALTLIAGCGKKNQSGKSNSSWDFSNPYGVPANVFNSPYSYGGQSLNTVLSQNPCISGMSGYTNQQRIQQSVPLTNFPTSIAPNDIYVGVTAYGDVAAIVGTAVGQPPVFVAYLCPRSFAPAGSGQLTGITIGAYTKCLFKPITAATMVFPGGATANFRWLDGGSSMRQRFSFCTL